MTVRVGTAGWSFPDWEGIVYPRGASRTREALALLSRLFDVLEINVSFYRPPTVAMARQWLAAVSGRPSFRFTAKIWRGFTHERDRRHAEQETAFGQGMAPLRESGRLTAVLAQFPQSFKNESASRAYLEELIERFRDFPLVVELRHVSWARDDVAAMLASRGVGLCTVDQPSVGAAAPPSTVMTGIGYVRLHGRNRRDWFRKDAGRDARYDYLYSHEEIQQWADRIGLMRAAARGRDIIVIANNHYRGQAPANALELKSLLSGGPVDVPELMLKAFPRLEKVAGARLRQGGQGALPL
ncbi:MAG TPA: DUF72 domain-containing protein [Candidatus Polarisedimenticolia bacterium]|nr:DUF72 domain-containing protein [Candidatus Polarisedimenticolia bacterium]